MTTDEVRLGTAREPIERYRVADLEVIPAGGDLLLVNARGNGSVAFLRPEVVDLLVRCREFRTLDDHLQAYHRRRQVNATAARTLRRELHRLAQDGYLISYGDLIEAFQKPAEQGDSSKIASIGFPTCNRVKTLERGMTSFVEYCRDFERTNEFVVVDDSAEPKTREEYRQMLKTLKSRCGVTVSYAGLEEKVAFANKLAQAGELPTDVAFFACVGDKQYGTTTVGSNRNALLLHTVGDLSFSADDDVLCHVAAPPNQREGIKFSSEGNPLELWLSPSQEAALQSVNYRRRDIFALHEQWLGKQPQVYLANHIREREVSFDRAEPRSLQKFIAQPGTVMLTLNGTVGDCGWDNPDFYLFQEGSTFKRLTRSERQYRSARASRDIVQAADQVVISNRADPIFTMCVGLDNRELLPPFVPVGRAEDVLFGAVLSKCFDAAYTVYLPWVLSHSPAQPRTFSKQRMFAIGLGSWLSSCLGRFDLGFARSPAECLHKLGQHLQELGHLPEEEFDEFVRLSIWHNMSSLISLLEEKLQSEERPPAFWVRDARTLVTLARQSALTPVEELYDFNGGRRDVQSLIVQFGKVLTWWPTMVETARSLRSEGQRLAQPV